MIKRVIFDVDNTLIEWKDKYLNALKDTIEEYGLKVSYIDVNDLIENYEEYYDIYKEEYLVKLINNKFKLNIDIEFINKWLKRLAFITEYNEDVVNIIKYLSNKYELVILSNWFKENQIARLDKAGLKEFFSSVVDSSKVIKPSKESFILACGNNKLEECVMVGDNYNIDIKVPLEIGLKAIYISSNKSLNKNNLKTIKNIKELKNIL